MTYRSLTSLALSTLLFSMVASANTSPQGITLQGTILTPASLPEEGAAVSFLIQIKSPGAENCLLYEETQTLNMTNSGGTFSLVIGTGTRAGTNFEDTSTLSEVFNNSGGTMSGLSCAVGTSYTPTSTNARNVVLTFDDGLGPQTLTQPLPVQAVPFAMHADTLQGKTPSDFLQPNTTAPADLTQANLESIFSTTNLTRLTNLLSVPPTNYVQTGSNGSASVPQVAGDPGSGLAAGQIWYDTTNNELKYHNGTSVEVIGSSSTMNAILPAQSGNSGKFLTTDGTSASWASVSATPGGANTQIQFNNSGAFGADSQLVWDNTNKRLGVGVAGPTVKLDVAGDIKTTGNIAATGQIAATGDVQVGNSSATCDAGHVGSIRYNSGTGAMEFCNSTGWTLLQGAACSDPVPDIMLFTNEANATTSTLVTSNAIQVTGMNCTVPIAISGQGSPQYQVCSDSACTTVVQGWTSTPSSLVSGEYIQARLTSGVAGGQAYKATFTVGSGATVWTVTTQGSCASSPAPGTICADGTIYVGESPDGGGTPMYTTHCDVGMTWDGVNCTGSRWTASWNNGTANWTTTGFTSSITGEANTTGLVALADAGAPYQAAVYCDNLSEDGYTDWYLPAKNELNIVYQVKDVIGTFTTSHYWSSTENNDSYAWNQDFSDGSQNNDNKDLDFDVRCVRR